MVHDFLKPSHIKKNITLSYNLKCDYVFLAFNFMFSHGMPVPNSKLGKDEFESNPRLTHGVPTPNSKLGKGVSAPNTKSSCDASAPNFKLDQDVSVTNPMLG
jgi:hypothetical protein